MNRKQKYIQKRIEHIRYWDSPMVIKNHRKIAQIHPQFNRIKYNKNTRIPSQVSALHIDYFLTPVPQVISKNLTPDDQNY